MPIWDRAKEHGLDVTNAPVKRLGNKQLPKTDVVLSNQMDKLSKQAPPTVPDEGLGESEESIDQTDFEIEDAFASIYSLETKVEQLRKSIQQRESDVRQRDTDVPGVTEQRVVQTAGHQKLDLNTTLSTKGKIKKGVSQLLQLRIRAALGFASFQFSITRRARARARASEEATSPLSHGPSGDSRCDQRREARHFSNFPLTFRSLMEPNEKREPGQIINMSAHGICITTRCKVEVGTPVSLFIELAPEQDGAQSREWYRVGVVVFVRWGLQQRLSDPLGFRRVGIRFCEPGK